jgi:FMN phosphatase YigB (HAD superfamily)
MITTLIFDFSRVLLFPIEQTYQGSLNNLHKELRVSKSYSLFNSFQLNQELLSYLDKIRTKYDLYIFTTGSIQNEPQLKQILDRFFKGVFSVEQLKSPKDSVETYLKLLKEINKKSSEVLFIDDTLENIKIAELAGIQTILYTNNQSLFEKLKVKIDLEA